MNTGFFKVPNILLEMPDLSVYQKMVLICLMRSGNAGAPIFPGYKTIAARCSISKSTAIKTVRELKELCLINVRVRKIGRTNTSNLYTVNEEMINQMYLKNNTDPVRYSDPGGVYRALPLVADTHPRKNHRYKEPDIKNHKTWNAQPRSALSFENYMDTNGKNIEPETTQLVRYYLASYERTLGRAHKNMRPEVWRRALDEVRDIYWIESGEPERADRGDFDEIKSLVDAYFSKTDKFAQPCDFSLPHFNSPGVKAVLYHEQWQY